MVFQGLAAAGAVGGVAGEAAALHLDGVYRAEPGGLGVHRIQKGQDGLLVGDGDVKAVQLPQPGQARGQVRQVQHLVLHGDARKLEQPLLDEGGHGVPDGVAEDGGVLCLHGVSLSFSRKI